MFHVLNWERPDIVNEQGIPILDEFYFNEGPATVFQDGYKSSKEKLENTRREKKYFITIEESTQDPRNTGAFNTDQLESTDQASTGQTKSNATRNKNAWLVKNKKQKPDIEPVVETIPKIKTTKKHKHRYVNTYKTDISQIVDNSNDQMQIRDQKNTNASVAFVCTAMLEYIYSKALKNVVTTCEFLKTVYSYEIKKYQLVLVKELSETFSEYIAISKHDGLHITVILNNNLSQLTTHIDGQIEGLVGKAYTDAEHMVFQDITNDDTLYFLKHSDYGNSLTTDDSMLNEIRQNGIIQLSPGFVAYFNNNIYETFESMTVTNHGVCTEELYSLEDYKNKKMPSDHAIHNATLHYIEDYYRVAPTIDAIRAFLIEENCVVGGFDCTYDIYNKDCIDTGIIPSPVVDNKGKKIIGGHCVLFVGFDDEKKLLKFKNSWGVDWGDKGYGYLPYDYVLMGFAADFWVVFNSTSR